jgi:hypothetical protein
MKRGQISLDFLFAVTLIALTMVNLVYIANSERSHAETFDTATKLKIFSVDVRDSLTKVYAAGNGFTLRKEAPFTLQGGDYINITLSPVDNLINVTAVVGGETYRVVQKSPVPILRESSVKLTPENPEFYITAQYNETEGRLYVRVSS